MAVLEHCLFAKLFSADICVPCERYPDIIVEHNASQITCFWTSY
jgi:hypothetical protein